MMMNLFSLLSADVPLAFFIARFEVLFNDDKENVEINFLDNEKKGFFMLKTWLKTIARSDVMKLLRY